jgi:hypothetical protein
MAIGLALVVAGLAGIGIYFYHRSNRQTGTLPTQIETAPPPPLEPLPAPSEPAPVPKTTRVPKPPPPPRTPKPKPAVNPQIAEVLSLQNLAREAYAKGNYAEPRDSSAIAYSKRVLAINPTDGYSKQLLDDGLKGAKYQVQRALARRDFGTAHRVANALAQLLPGWREVAALEEDIAAAERAAQAARRPKAVTGQAASFRVYHMHSSKSPADRGPYCTGTLSVGDGRLKFKGEEATDGEPHSLEFACSDVHEIKKNARVASHQGGFHVRTDSGNFNFVPLDSATGIVSALNASCSQ